MIRSIGTHPRIATWIGAVTMMLLLSGCADRTIRLHYHRPPEASIFTNRLTIVRFTDQRGNEGDHGDPYRVGGFYGGYGNRLSKVMASRPWLPDLMWVLRAAFRAEGIDAKNIDRAPAPPLEAYVLEGDVHNFSTESRWSARAHISAIVRLRDRTGQVVVDKEVKAVETGGMGMLSASQLEQLLNAALAKFARTLATDSDITTALTGRSVSAQ